LVPLEASEGPVLVVHAGGLVSTAEVFSHPELTRDTPAIKIHDLASSKLANDCEGITRRLHPEVGRVLDWLRQHADARMSGTGACVFAAFEDISQAHLVAEELPESWAWFVAQRRNTSPLIDKLRQLRGRE
jgi:4-diphosphocytidyl-2-C-methyl-D-erythritol kinase